MSETREAGPQVETRTTRPNNFVGWMGTAALMATGNFIFDPYFDTEVQNSAALLGGGIIVGTVASLLKIPSPFIVMRTIVKPSIKAAVRIARGASEKIGSKFRARSKPPDEWPDY